MKIFLGGYPAVGKTTFAGWLRDGGWHMLDFDLTTPTSRVSDLLDAPASHPDFNHLYTVAEGGFLDEAPRFQAMIDRVGFFPIWLTGSRARLYASRIARNDDPAHVRDDWIGLVDKHCRQIQWRLEVDMWHPSGRRKTGPEVLEEIVRGMP
jgi:hypothetical protein